MRKLFLPLGHFSCSPSHSGWTSLNSVCTQLHKALKDETITLWGTMSTCGKAFPIEKVQLYELQCYIHPFRPHIYLPLKDRTHRRRDIRQNPRPCSCLGKRQDFQYSISYCCAFLGTRSLRDASNVEIKIRAAPARPGKPKRSPKGIARTDAHSGVRLNITTASEALTSA